MRTLMSILTLSAIALLITASDLGANRQPSDLEMLYAVERFGHTDGTFSYRHLAYDNHTGRFSAVAPQAERVPQINHLSFQRLLVRQSSKWRRSTTQNFRWAEKAPTLVLKKKLPLVKGVTSFVNKRKGHNSIPRFNQLNRRQTVRDIRPRHSQTHARDPVREYQQFDFDNINVIARTADNRFFFFDRPDISSRSIRFEFATCSLGGGVFRCPYFIVKCDIYFRARTFQEVGFFEDLPLIAQRRALAGHYKFCQGHSSNTWGQDLAGNRNREVNTQTFNKNNSRVWQHMRDVDTALYRDAGVAVIAQAVPSRYLLPKRSSVIDVGFLKRPIYDPTRSARQNAFAYDAIVLTNLKGFTNGKDLRMEIFRGRNTKPVNRIFILRGASIDRNRGTLNGRKALARYHQSYLHIGREADYNKLLGRLKQPQNQGKVVRGLAYDYVMEVTIRVSGFEKENGGRQRVSNVYFLVYNEGEERDPPFALFQR